MKALDNGLRLPQKKSLRNAITKSIAAVTIVSISSLAIAQDKSLTKPNAIDNILVYNPATVIPDQYIVVFKDEVVDVQARAMVSRNLTFKQAKQALIREISVDLATRAGGDVDRTYSSALNGFVLKSSAKNAVSALTKDNRVAYIEADQMLSVGATQNNATWGLDRIDQTNLPLNGTYVFNQDGTGVNAYIIDTGVRISHNQFGNRGRAGFTAINDGRGSSDCNGHGTHVAGTVGSSTYGVAKNTTIHAVRVLGCNGSGSNSGVIAGVDWVAANHSDPAVANMSLGGGVSGALDSAVNSVVNQGVTMVVAAGNDNSNACNFSPARASRAITVGSTIRTDARSSFSNFGTCLDIFAPGSSITSTWSTSNSATNTISGTSMAAPHVAGAAALYLDANPNATPTQVESAIENAASVGRVSNPRSGSPNLLLNTNFGGGGNPPPPPPSNDFFENTTNVTIPGNRTGTVSSNINVTRNGASGTIRVRARIIHTWRGDLSVRIFAPNGASGTVHAQTNPNDSRDNLILDVNLNAGTIQSNGTWRLEVTDSFAQDGGFLDEWSIEFQ